MNIGDIIKVKDGIKSPKLKVDLSDWHGRITEVDKKSVEVELDSITLKNLDARLVEHYKRQDEYPHIVTIPIKDVEKADARDSYEEVERAQDELIDLMDREKDEPKFQMLSRKWVRHFVRSDRYKSMEKQLRLETDSIIELFTNQMYDYENQTPRKWKVRAAREVFFNWAPNKITAEKDFFEAYEIVLLNFFEFLSERKYLNAKPLANLLKNNAGEIVRRSQDNSNWGMAKSFMMGAQRSGVNLNNKQELDAYMVQKQMEAIKSIKGGGKATQKKSLREFKGIWLNQKVSVRYKSGEIKEVKFKEVKEDLLNGICELIKK